MRDLGTPADRFRRAARAGSLPLAEAAMRELGSRAGHEEMLELVGLTARAGDPRYGRAAARWVARVSEAREVGLHETRTLLALLQQTPELMAMLRRRLRDTGSSR